MPSPRPPQRGDVLRETLPTRDDASSFFDSVVARLGDRAVVQTSGGGKNRMLFLRAGGDGPFLLPWPLLGMSISDLPPDVDPLLEDDDRPAVSLDFDPEGGPVQIPFTFRPVPATFTLYDGDVQLYVNYRWNGGWKDAGQPGEDDAFPGFVDALARPGIDRRAALRDYVVAIDLGRHGPARVVRPRPTKGGIGGVWAVGSAAIRGAIASRATPPGSFWVAADGYAGTAIAFGSSRDEALDLWRKEVERVRPTPPKPVDPETFPRPGGKPSWAPREWSPSEPPEDEGGVVIRVGGWDAPPFDPSPASAPAAVVRVAALPTEKPARGAWTRWLGDRGTTEFALRIPTEGGYTLVGQRLLPLVDLDTLDATLDALEAATPNLVPPPDLPTSVPLTHKTVMFRYLDFTTGLPIDPRAEQRHTGATLDPKGFDAALLRTYVVRVRALDE